MSLEDSKKEYHGVWWVVDEPEAQARGALRLLDEGRLALDLDGTLGKVRVPGFDLPSGLHRIVGQIDGGRTVSLDRCFATSARGLLGVPRQNWHVHEAVFDARFDAVEPWAFYGARFSMPLLSSWVQSTGVEQQFELHEDNTWKRMGVSFAADTFPLWQSNGASLQLGRCGAIRQSSETITEVESRLDLLVQPERAMESHELRRLARPLQLLVGLSSGKFTTVTSGAVLISVPDASARKHYLDWKWQPIEVPDVSRNLTRAFSYSNWRDVSAGKTDEWLAHLHRIDPVIDLYLASLRQVGYAELSFQIVVQALETYHRRVYGGTLLLPTDWEALQSCLNKSVNEFALMREDSEEWRKIFLGKFTHLNEVSLNRRLKDLFEELGVLAEVVAGEPVNRFARRIVATRNYYTHWDARNESEALTDAALFHASSRLLALLELLLLRDSGFDVSTTAAKTILDRRVSWLRS